MPSTPKNTAAPRVMLTGATGFLGGHVLDALAAHSQASSCFVLVQNEQAWRQSSTARRHPHVTPIVGTLLDAGRWSHKVPACDAIIHLAALVRHSRTDADQVFQVNVEGTRNMVELAARHRARMLFVSTSGVVACSRRLADAPSEDAPYCLGRVKRWPYYASKIQAEQAARYVAQHHDVPLTILRPPAMYGPGDEKGRATSLLRQFLGGKLPFMLSGGINVCDVRDVADAIVQALHHPQPRPIYHLPGHAEDLRSFFGRLERLSKRPGPKVVIPYSVAWPTAWVTDRVGRQLFGHPLPPRIDPVVVEMARHHWNMASRYAEQDLHYKPRFIDETLIATLNQLQRVAP